jgi:hypothetical protein
MVTDRVNLPSVVYWRGQRQPQRFYVALCLLMSSIQDFLLGHKERRSANLNWSATCSYYSLVHAGRLLAFIALGDYPTSHAELRRLFGRSSHQARRRLPGRDGYPFDWLRGFSAEVRSDSQGHELDAQAPSTCSPSELRDAILGYLTDTGVQRTAERLELFGDVLAAAAELRNDSNYEALLMAHEYEHVSMTSAFANLAKHMCEAADSSRPVVLDAFTCFLRRDPDLEEDRPGYVAWARQYLTRRLLPAIGRKVAGFDDLQEKLNGIVSGLDLPATRGDYQHLEDVASLHIFDAKARLMARFVDRIEKLARATGGQAL